jgi:hypothetical protein
LKIFDEILEHIEGIMVEEINDLSIEQINSFVK